MLHEVCVRALGQLKKVGPQTPTCACCRFPDTTPDALHLHKTLAGIADRGGSTALVECGTGAMHDGRCVGGRGGGGGGVWGRAPRQRRLAGGLFL